MKKACLVVTLLALGACSEKEAASGPGEVTLGEKRALEEAAEMLDERAPPAQPTEASTAGVIAPLPNGNTLAKSGT